MKRALKECVHTIYIYVYREIIQKHIIHVVTTQVNKIFAKLTVGVQVELEMKNKVYINIVC